MNAHREEHKNHNSRHSDVLSSTSTEDNPANDLQFLVENQDASLELLRDLIFGEYRQQVARMRAEVSELQSLLDGLEQAGFKLDFGEGGTGWPLKYRTRGGGYYFNVGCSELIVKRQIGLVQYQDITSIGAQGVQMRDGRELQADLIVLATGYKGPGHLVESLFGQDLAQRVGPVWGFDAHTQEMRNMWTRTAQPGLWFTAGAFSQCRIYSKILALQIKAAETGMH